MCTTSFHVRSTSCAFTRAPRQTLAAAACSSNGSSSGRRHHHLTASAAQAAAAPDALAAAEATTSSLLEWMQQQGCVVQGVELQYGLGQQGQVYRELRASKVGWTGGLVVAIMPCCTCAVPAAGHTWHTTLQNRPLVPGVGSTLLQDTLSRAGPVPHKSPSHVPGGGMAVCLRRTCSLERCWCQSPSAAHCTTGRQT